MSVAAVPGAAEGDKGDGRRTEVPGAAVTGVGVGEQQPVDVPPVEKFVVGVDLTVVIVGGVQDDPVVGGGRGLRHGVQEAVEHRRFRRLVDPHSEQL